jgi:hypothetical protein
MADVTITELSRVVPQPYDSIPFSTGATTYRTSVSSIALSVNGLIPVVAQCLVPFNLCNTDLTTPLSALIFKVPNNYRFFASTITVQITAKDVTRSGGNYAEYRLVNDAGSPLLGTFALATDLVTGSIDMWNSTANSGSTTKAARSTSVDNVIVRQITASTITGTSIGSLSGLFSVTGYLQPK